MSTFKEDVQLLVELQSLIMEAQKTAEMPQESRTALKAVLGAKAQKAIPQAQAQAARRIDILTRAKARLEELMELNHEGGR